MANKSKKLTHTAFSLVGLIASLMFLTTIYIELFNHRSTHQFAYSDTIDTLRWSLYDRKTGALETLLEAQYATKKHHQWHLTNITLHHYQANLYWTIQGDRALYDIRHQTLEVSGHVQLHEHQSKTHHRVLTGDHFLANLIHKNGR